MSTLESHFDYTLEMVMDGLERLLNCLGLQNGTQRHEFQASKISIIINSYLIVSDGHQTEIWFSWRPNRQLRLACAFGTEARPTISAGLWTRCPAWHGMSAELQIDLEKLFMFLFHLVPRCSKCLPVFCSFFVRSLK